MVIQKDRKESLDQFSITKAAAWAWYERGSWFENKSIREMDCKRTHDYTPKPSRYKLEAVKKLQKENNEIKTCISNSLLCNKQVDHNPLLDRYEIERISRKLDCYLEKFRKSEDGGDNGGDPGGRRIMSEGTNSKKKGMSKKTYGFRMQHGLMCRSSRDDVHENLVIIRGRRRQQKEDVTANGVMNSRRSIIRG